MPPIKIGMPTNKYIIEITRAKPPRVSILDIPDAIRNSENRIVTHPKKIIVDPAVSGFKMENFLCKIKTPRVIREVDMIRNR